MRTDVPPYINSSFYRWDNEELLRKVLKLGWYLSLPILGLYIHCLTTTKNNQGFILENLPSRLAISPSFAWPHQLTSPPHSCAEWISWLQYTANMFSMSFTPPHKRHGLQGCKARKLVCSDFTSIFRQFFFPPLECSLYLKKKEKV